MAASDHSTLTAVRSAVNTYRVSNGRGAELLIGSHDAEGAFSPMELLQAALAGCTALSAEQQLASKLGDTFDAEVAVDVITADDGSRATHLNAALTADMSELEVEDVEKLIRYSERVIERLCAVKRSLNAGVQATAEVRATAQT